MEQWIVLFNLILVIVCIIYLIRSWQRGFVLQLIDLVSWLFSAVIAWVLCGYLSKALPILQLSLTELDGVNDFISTQASSIAWFLIIAIGLRLITVIAHPFAQALNRLPLIGGINRLAGLLLGMAKALIIGYLLLVICYLPVFDQGKVIAEHSFLKYCAPLADFALNSGGSMLQRLELIDSLQNDTSDQDTVSRIEEWIQNENDRGEGAIFDWLESLQ